MLSDLVIIFVIAWAAATISGAAGFGGALILLPFLAGMVGIKAAVPILTIAQIFGNASRVWFGRHELKWRPVIFFLVTAIPFSLLGSFLFGGINENVIKVGLGVFLIMLVIYRRLKLQIIKPGEKTMLLGGALTGIISGLAGSAGPLGAAFFLGLNLGPVAYVASEAFTALSMHITKTIVYNRFSLIGLTELYFGLFIGAAMILGSWTGKRIIEKLSHKRFLLLVEVLLVLSGLQLIVSAVFQAANI